MSCVSRLVAGVPYVSITTDADHVAAIITTNYMMPFKLIQPAVNMSLSMDDLAILVYLQYRQIVV